MPKDRYVIEALARGMEALALFTRETPHLSLGDVTASLGCTKSMAYRILSTLEVSGYLTYDQTTRRYCPTVRVLELGFTAIHALGLRENARPLLEALVQAVGETVSLAVLSQGRVLYLERIHNRAIVGIMLGVGSQVPAHATALGKVLLAGLTRAECEQQLALQPLQALTPNTLTDREALLAELEKVRRQGYAVDDEELAPGLRAVAAPVYDEHGHVVAAINITGATTTITHERIETELAPALIATAHAISRALGFAGRAHVGAPG
ncbi:MAG TPA: IclR family transcriptional regulator [Chloroflexi bacterium]|nr:IclR family transcriptional regulator [Chloroflexota bacterium]HHW86053.1 IclR family transcriptional regulator [Chloroflexota bacterium]